MKENCPHFQYHCFSTSQAISTSWQVIRLLFSIPPKILSPRSFFEARQMMTLFKSANWHLYSGRHRAGNNKQKVRQGMVKFYKRGGVWHPPPPPFARYVSRNGLTIGRLIMFIHVFQCSPRGCRSIQARQIVFQLYYRLLAQKFSNGGSLRHRSGGKTCHALYPRASIRDTQ